MATKQYGDIKSYERKLETVMKRLGVKADGYNYGRDRYGAYIDFDYKGQRRRFDYTMEKSRELAAKNPRVKALHVASDCFAVLVLSLEDLVRMIERGVYDLDAWIGSLPLLAAPSEIPSFFRYLGFNEIPDGPDDVIKAYRVKAHLMHPDKYQDPEAKKAAEADFKLLVNAKEQALQFFGASDNEG